jgi:hypothetical protein
LTKVDIIKLINKKLTELENSVGLAATPVMPEVKAIITSNIMDGMEFDSDTGEFNFNYPDQIPEEFWRSGQKVTTQQLNDAGELVPKIKMHPKLRALKLVYDRHRLTGEDGNVSNFTTSLGLRYRLMQIVREWGCLRFRDSVHAE